MLLWYDLVMNMRDWKGMTLRLTTVLIATSYHTIWVVTFLNRFPLNDRHRFRTSSTWCWKQIKFYSVIAIRLWRRVDSNHWTRLDVIHMMTYYPLIVNLNPIRQWFSSVHYFSGYPFLGNKVFDLLSFLVPLFWGHNKFNVRFQKINANTKCLLQK